MMLKKMACLLLAFGLGSANAWVVSNSSLQPSNQNSLGTYELTVIQNPVSGDYTSMYFNVLDNAGQMSLSPVTTNADEGSDWYVMGHGDVLSLQTLSTGSFQSLFVTDPVSNRLVPRDVNLGAGSNFYLGFATSGPFPIPPGPQTSSFPRNVFGWVHLGRDNTGAFSLLDNATAYGSEGIVVGLPIEVPEPSAVWLMTLGLAGMMGLRKMKASR